MSIIATMFIGLLVGMLAKLLMPGKDPAGLIITTLLGIAGAFAARYVGIAAGWYLEGDLVGFIASGIGAIISLGVYRLLFRRVA